MALKTRDLPLYEYFTKLQEEYVCAELRYKIYPRTRDKQYYRSKLMDGKKKVIDDISFRNGLPSIFNSDNQKNKVYLKIYGESGYPNFLYKDDYEKRLLEHNDKNNYYSIGESFKVVDVEVKVGILKELNASQDTCVLSIDGRDCKYKLDQVTRIL